MRPITVPGDALADSPDFVLAAAVAIAAALATVFPLLEMVPCMKLWLHGVAACLP